MESQDPNQAIKILIIDDHILFREGLVSLFKSIPDFEVIGEGGTVHEGISLAFELHPDIILMDFSLPDGTGLDATTVILSEFPDCKIVFLTVNERSGDLLAALQGGAKGYMLKNIPSKDLISSLRALGCGEVALSRQMFSLVVDELSRSPGSTTKEDPELLSKLSRRELDVLRELGTGATNLEIAQRLFLSENTVKHHVRNLFSKLGVENRRQASALARKHGLTP